MLIECYLVFAQIIVESLCAQYTHNLDQLVIVVRAIEKRLLAEDLCDTYKEHEQKVVRTDTHKQTNKQHQQQQ